MGREILSLAAPPADLRIPYGDQPSQFIDFRYPPSPATGCTVVMVHGGFWRAAYDLLHAGHFCAALTAAGMVTANVEYRRVGEAGGGWPSTLEDVSAAVEFVRNHRGRRGRTLVAGHSAGGHLALWLAAEHQDLAGVVALAPVACLQTAWNQGLGSGAVAGFLGGPPAEVPERYALACPSQRPAVPPRTLIHGTADGIVPLSQSREYVQARAGDPGGVRLLELPGADHFDVIDPRSAAWPAVLDAIRSAASASTLDHPNQSPNCV